MEATNKIALITGGSRGLGRNMAQHLSAQGHNIIITYNSNLDEANKVVADIEAKGGKAIALKLDVGNVASIALFVAEVAETLQSKFGRSKFDFLINNGGMGQTIPFANSTENDVDRFYNVHFKGPYFLIQHALPFMNDGGRIINISTGTTRFVNPGYQIYASMKSGLETLTKYLAKELGTRQINVNVVAPGAIETEFNNAFIRSNEQVKKMIAGNTPLGRVGMPDDIGPVVAFLCSEGGRWINAQRIEVSGGVNA